ncbi:MAG TPA: hypothetical protein VJT71_05305 [Pyrinomonadaceae bacterium]|nr:hypothetical protein [Pyrinomonadaceae bacterium]
MSKQINTRVIKLQSGNHTRPVISLAISLALLALIASGIATTSAQRATPGPEAKNAAAQNAAFVAATNEVLKETSEIRELAVLRPVQSSAQSRAEIQQMIMNNLDRETTPAQIHATEVTLKRLGLAPPDFRFRDLMIRLLTEQVAGYYDPKSQKFHLADWIDVDGQKPIMAHELTHALQDQHFNLRRFEKWPKGDSDTELAIHALIEGDATLAMASYVSRSPSRMIALFKSLGTAGVASQELDKAPRAVRESLLFPYQEGLAFAQTVHKFGGWKEVSEAYTNLPQSTEQIRHPEKFFAREAPVKVSLPDISATLNGRRGRLQGWKRIDFDVNGEWGTYLILDQFLKSPVESQQAAAGWGGDSYAVYENRAGQALYVSVSTWDREKDAREFFDAYVKRTELRYPGTVSAPAQNLADSRQFETGEGTVVIQLRGSRVLVLEGVTRQLNWRTLVSALKF